MYLLRGPSLRRRVLNLCFLPLPLRGLHGSVDLRFAYRLIFFLKT